MSIYEIQHWIKGSSPRMRGAQDAHDVDDAVDGFIPAYAGSTGSAPRRPRAAWVHPRVCGEHSRVKLPLMFTLGSSPRMRGAHAFEEVVEQGRGFIPAYAGSTSTVSRRMETRGVHPRVCGEHHAKKTVVDGIEGSSPRMRGALFRNK